MLSKLAKEMDNTCIRLGIDSASKMDEAQVIDVLSKMSYFNRSRPPKQKLRRLFLYL